MGFKDSQTREDSTCRFYEPNDEIATFALIYEKGGEGAGIVLEDPPDPQYWVITKIDNGMVTARDNYNGTFEIQFSTKNDTAKWVTWTRDEGDGGSLGARMFCFIIVLR